MWYECHFSCCILMPLENLHRMISGGRHDRKNRKLRMPAVNTPDILWIIGSLSP